MSNTINENTENEDGQLAKNKCFGISVTPLVRRNFILRFYFTNANKSMIIKRNFE